MLTCYFTKTGKREEVTLVAEKFFREVDDGGLRRSFTSSTGFAENSFEAFRVRQIFGSSPNRWKG